MQWTGAALHYGRGRASPCITVGGIVLLDGHRPALRSGALFFWTGAALHYGPGTGAALHYGPGMGAALHYGRGTGAALHYGRFGDAWQ